MYESGEVAPDTVRLGFVRARVHEGVPIAQPLTLIK